MGQVNVSFAPVITKHVKKTLPPSLTGFPGEAEIKYYVKATVVRPKFFQENLRSVGHASHRIVTSTDIVPDH